MSLEGAPARRDGDVMRATAAMLCLLLVAGSAPSRAQPYTGPDGFAICPYAKGVIGKCAPLTDAAVRDYGLGAAQADIVGRLRSFAIWPEKRLLEAIVNTKLFAAPRPFGPGGEYSDYWFPDPASPSNVECGIHFRYIKEDLMQMTYAVDRIFIVIWSRVAVVPPR